jgi:glutaminase
MRQYVLGFSLALVLATSSYAEPNYQGIINQAYAKFRLDNKGQNASYIPALAKINSNYYSIALVTVEGKVYAAGDSKITFPLESIAKVFNLALAMQQYGAAEVLDKLGARATGLPFNSVLAVELQPNHTGNALVNAGAIATVSLIKGESEAKWAVISNNLNAYANSTLPVNQTVYQSETATNQHNQAIARLLDSYGRLYGKASEAVDLYTRACSVDASVIELAKMGAVLANQGKSPYTGKQLLNEQYVPKILSMMATAGMYDTSGTWLYKVGVPAKSGVGGGVVAIVPGKLAIAAYSPPLDSAGNSVRAQEAIEYIAQQLNANIFK